MKNKLNKAIKAIKTAKAVFFSKEFGLALDMVSYKLDNLEMSEKQALRSLKRSYLRERANVRNIHNQKKEIAVKAFLSDLSTIYKMKAEEYANQENNYATQKYVHC